MQFGKRRTFKTYHRAGWLYAMQRPWDQAIKIGRSSNPGRRLREINADFRSCTRITGLLVVPVGCMACSEREVLEYLTADPDKWGVRRLDGEWFALTPEDAMWALLECGPVRPWHG